ncbi:hypothetical protein KQ929_13310 [Leclercia pneumoniae]|uniref:Uncharacterized protein n=1 Tax=Leclercia pneumoniae TaxID=2815358 RepID=A0ABX8JT89_9ENTR|nr:hypothetical protein [Leclercia pneumoniae]QSW36840.1 hypothetical protein JZ655_07205 [Leclercia pneumoniae]QWW78243.1 hypothetical protein KQ929_13310 [Leclercia pneumoniae]
MEIITIIGVLLTLAGLFVPSLISNHSSRKAEFRKQSAPVLEKLLSEIQAIQGGSYPHKLISYTDFYQLLPYVPVRRRKAIRDAYASYLEAHSVAVTKHWHDVHPSSGTVFFPASFIVTNPAEVLEKMQRLKKELTS